MRLRYSYQDLLQNFTQKTQTNHMISEIKGIKIIWNYMKIERGFLISSDQMNADYVLMSLVGDMIGNTKTQISYNMKQFESDMLERKKKEYEAKVLAKKKPTA